MDISIVSLSSRVSQEKVYLSVSEHKNLKERRAGLYEGRENCQDSAG